MEYEDEGGYPGTLPEYGAIFMSNAETKKECLRRKLFGLPSAQANFVKCVKAGMVLFLFEFEKRQLYGVYRACSDGAMDIMPHAFKSSGKPFPAQICFTVIWNCKPLSEHEFRDAIRENYYSRNKFSFGLSEDQVRRLLSLFSSKKLENMVPLRRFREPKSLTGRVSGKAKLCSRNREEKLIEEESPAHTNNIEYSGDSRSDSKRPEEERFQENAFGYDTMAEHEWVGFGRREQVVNDSVDLVDNYDVHHNLSDSLYIPKTSSKDNQFQHRDVVYSDLMETANSPTKARDLLARAPRDTEDGKCHQRDTRGDKRTPSHEPFWEGKPVQRFEFPQTECRRPIDEQRLLMDRKVDYDHNLVGEASTDIPAHYVLRRTSDDDDQLYVNDRIEIGNSIDDGIRPSNKHGELKRTTDEETRIPTELFSSSLVYGGIPNHHDRFSGRIFQETETLVNNSLSPITSRSHYLHPSERINPSDDDQMLVKTSRQDNAYTSRKSSGAPLSRAYAELRQPRKQPSINSNNPMLEAHYSLSQNQQKTTILFPNSIEQTVHAKSYQTSLAMDKYNISKLMSSDSVCTRTVPYDPDFPHDVMISSQSLQNSPPQHSHVKDDFVTSLKIYPYCTKAEDFSQQYDGALGRRSEVPWHDRKDLNDHSHQKIGQSLSSGQYRGKMEQPFSGHESYEDPLPLSNHPMYRSRNTSISVESDECLTSQEKVAHDFQENVTYPASGDHRDLLVNSGTGRAHSSLSLKLFDEHDMNSYQDLDYPDGVPTDSEQKRASVFARLSMSSGKREKEHEGCIEGDALDPSVDELMDSLFESLGKEITYITKHSRSVKRPNTEQTLGCKRQYKRRNQIEVDEPTMVAQKMIKRCIPVTKDEEDGKDMLRETRIIGFKRRSETKKGQDVVKTNGVAESSLGKETEISSHKTEGKREGEDKQLKRRKLIRPSFSKKEELNEVVSGQIRSSKFNKKLVGPSFSKKEEPKDDKEMGFRVYSSHLMTVQIELPSDSAVKSPGNPSNPSFNSLALDSCTPPDLGEITVSPTNPKVETNDCSRHEQSSVGSQVG